MTPAFILTAVLLFPANAPERVTSPADYVALVAADLATVPEERQASQLYVVIPPWREPNQAARAAVVAMNMIGRRRSLVAPRIATDKYIAFDLFELVSKAEDFADFAAVVSEMTLLDPWFYTPVEVLPTKPDYPVGENVNHQDGEHYFDCPFCKKRHKSSEYGKLVQCIECKERFRVPAKNPVIIKTGRQLAPHLGLEQIGGLVLLSGSPTPIITIDTLVARALFTADDIGFYYKLKGIDGLSLEEILKSLGADQAFSEDRGGEAAKFAIMNHSGVTGKPRVALIIKSRVGAVLITFDFEDNADFFAFLEKTALERNPWNAILAFIFNASEIIWEEDNGLHGFLLADGDGNQADEVPPNIAIAERPRPRTLPRGGGFGTARLQSGFDCFVCHAKGTYSGMQPIENQLANARGFDIFDDLEERFADDAVKIIADRYGQTLDKELDEIRADYSLAVFRLVKDYDVEPGDDVVNQVAQDFAAIWYDYEDLVDAQRAALELGYKFESNEDAIAWLRLNLSQRLGSGAARLLGGMAIPRNDWNRELAQLAFAIAEVGHAER